MTYRKAASAAASVGKKKADKGETEETPLCFLYNSFDVDPECLRDAMTAWENLQTSMLEHEQDSIRSAKPSYLESYIQAQIATDGEEVGLFSRVPFASP